MKKTCSRVIGFFLLMNSAWGAPFLTDDPNITPYKHFELYLFGNLNNNDIDSVQPQLQAPAIEFDYGLSANTQFQLIAPYGWTFHINDVPAANGVGDFQVGMKYRFAKNEKSKFEIAVFPLLLIPIGSLDRNLGNGTEAASLPIWAQKKWGAWTLNAGGGYTFNAAKDTRHFPFGGVELQREFNSHLSLGVEIYSQGSLNIDSRPYTLINAGGIYSITKHFALFFSGGNSIFGERHLTAYFALEWVGP